MMSERDGWNHLYLYDGITGRVKKQITKGNWVVRGVDKVDDQKRQLVSGKRHAARQGPILCHYYRINFDGTGLLAITEGDANHSVSYSTEIMKYYVDTWSRIDLAPVSELRLTEDRKLVASIEQGSIEKLREAGWRPLEVFTFPWA